MNRSSLRGLFFIALTGVFVACQKSSKGPTVAKVGSMAIPLADLEGRMGDTPPNYQIYLASTEGRRQFLGLMIREKVLLIEAQKSGVTKEAAYMEAVARFKEQWERRLSDFQESLMIQSYLNKLRSKEVAVTDTEVEHFYRSHEDDFLHPREIQTSHILLSSEEEAQQALARLKTEPFEKVARAMSRDAATAIKGGKMDPFVKGLLPQEFEEAAFKLKTGEVSGIVKTTFGFHIIKKTGERTLKAVPFESAKEKIRARLERDKFDQWVTAKQNELGVRIDDKVLAGATIPMRPLPSGMIEANPQEPKP